MLAKPECVTCSFNQLLVTAKKVTTDPVKLKKLLDRAGAEIAAISLDVAPAEITGRFFKLAVDELGVDDPYREEKRKYNLRAMELLPLAARCLDESEDRLHTAVKLAIAGNLMDLGIIQDIDVSRLLGHALESPLTIDDSLSLISDLQGGRTLLYIGDNAGELVFDKLLIEELRRVTGCNPVFAVRGGIVMNDALMEDAQMVGLPDIAQVITTGSDYLGVSMKECSAEFADAVKAADVIIAKGHANYETMGAIHDRQYHLLTVKCKCVAQEMNLFEGASVLLKKTGAC